MKWALVPKRKFYACVAIFGGDYIYHDGDSFVKWKIRKQFNSIKERQDLEAKAALEGEVVPLFPPIHLDKERDDVFDSVKVPFKSINLVFGPDSIGKTVAMITYAEKQAAAGRTILYLPIGKINSNPSSANTSLTSDVLKALNVPERRSVLGYLCQPLISAYCSYKKIPYIASNRVDYAFRMLSDCMEDAYQDNVKEVERKAHLMTTGHLSHETILDYDKCRPVLVVDEGHQNYDGTWKRPLPVDNSAYNAEKTELTRKLLQQVFAAHSKESTKPFEVWVTGHDNKLIEECAVKYKRSSPCVTYVLEDSLSHSGFHAHLDLPPLDAYRINSPDTVTLIETVFGNRMNDVVDCLVVSCEEVGVIVNQHVSTAEADLQQLLAACHSDATAATQLKTALDLMSQPNKNTTNINGIRNCNAVALTSLPACVKQSPAFERVLFSVLGQVNFSRPVYKYCWRKMNGSYNNNNNNNTGLSKKSASAAKGWLW